MTNFPSLTFYILGQFQKRVSFVLSPKRCFPLSWLFLVLHDFQLFSRFRSFIFWNRHLSTTFLLRTLWQTSIGTELCHSSPPHPVTSSSRTNWTNRFLFVLGKVYHHPMGNFENKPEEIIATRNPAQGLTYFLPSKQTYSTKRCSNCLMCLLGKLAVVRKTRNVSSAMLNDR